MILDLDIL